MPVQANAGARVATDSRGAVIGGTGGGRATLKRWSLEIVRVNGANVAIVRGVRCDIQNPVGCLWRTSEIVRAETPTLLVTRKSEYVELVGRLYKPLAEAVGLANRLAKLFATGFPLHEWRQLVDRARLPRWPSHSRPAVPEPAKAADMATVVSESESDCVFIGQPAQPLRPAPAALGSRPALGRVRFEAPRPRGKARPRTAIAMTGAGIEGVAAMVGSKPVVAPSKPRRRPTKLQPVEALAAAPSNPRGRHRRRALGDDRNPSRTAANDASEDCPAIPPSEAGCARRWREADVELLRLAMDKVRPSAPHYWRRVAFFVGRPEEECQARAQGGRGCRAASADAGGDTVGTKRRRRRTAAKPILAAGVDEADVEASLAVGALPARDGPRRAQKVRKLLDFHSFGANRDLLTLPAAMASAPAAEVAAVTDQTASTGELAAEAACDTNAAIADDVGAARDVTSGDTPAAAAPSDNMRPDCSTPAPSTPCNAGVLDFLVELHTGCTPPATPSRQRARLPTEADGRPLPPPAGLESTEESLSSLLGLGDGTWQPKGIDRFICDARARRGKLLAPGRSAEELRGCARPLRAADLQARMSIRRAPRLFRKVYADAAHAVAAFDCGMRAPSESEDDAAPIAYIPKAPRGVGVTTPPEDDEGKDRDEDM